ncbi:MAG: PqqD family protein [Candidatus Eremiobacteraeota bacterium]|nr:PqqD family protein [Candidatus Eremiobacteraeota bacterium]
MEIWKEDVENVVSDLIEGEMMLLNLKVGNYYALQGSGVQLWPALKHGSNFSTLLNALALAFPDLTKPQLESDLEEWMQQLRQEGLIIPTQGEPWEDFALSGDYLRPGLEAFTDLQELFLLDPIHDAAPDKGWPAQ